MTFRQYNTMKFNEQLALRYELMIANKKARLHVFMILAFICLVEYLRFIGG